MQNQCAFPYSLKAIAPDSDSLTSYRLQMPKEWCHPLTPTEPTPQPPKWHFGTCVLELIFIGQKTASFYELTQSWTVQITTRYTHLSVWCFTSLNFWLLTHYLKCLVIFSPAWFPKKWANVWRALQVCGPQRGKKLDCGLFLPHS